MSELGDRLLALVQEAQRRSQQAEPITPAFIKELQDIHDQLTQGEQALAEAEKEL